MCSLKLKIRDIECMLKIMPFSLHSHSGQFCQHATGMLEEIVLEAIKKKFLVYGLSEHCPRYRIQDLYPEEVKHEEQIGI